MNLATIYLTMFVQKAADLIYFKHTGNTLKTASG